MYFHKQSDVHSLPVSSLCFMAMRLLRALLAILAVAIAIAFALFSNPYHVVGGSSLPLESSSRLSPQFDGRDTSNLGAYFRSSATGLWMFRTDTPAATTRKAAVILVHGFSEHHQRFDLPARALFVHFLTCQADILMLSNNSAKLDTVSTAMIIKAMAVARERGGEFSIPLLALSTSQVLSDTLKISNRWMPT